MSCILSFSAGNKSLQEKSHDFSNKNKTKNLKIWGEWKWPSFLFISWSKFTYQTLSFPSTDVVCLKIMSNWDRYIMKQRKKEKKRKNPPLHCLPDFEIGGKSSICFTGSSLAINWPLRILFCPMSFHREWQMLVCPSPNPPPLLPPAWASFPPPPTPSAPSFGCKAWKRSYSPGALGSS